MTLKELFNILIKELGARRLAPGEPGRPVKGLSVDEETEGWLGPDEIAVTDRKILDPRFLAAVAEGGAPAVVWRVEHEPPAEGAEHAQELGLGLLALPPNVPTRKLLSLFTRDSEGEELLRHSHGAARALLESAGGEASVAKLAGKLAGLLGRSVVVEDPVGRLIAGGDPTKANANKGNKGNRRFPLLPLFAFAFVGSPPAMRRPTGSSTTTERPRRPASLPASLATEASPPALSRRARAAPWECRRSSSPSESLVKSERSLRVGTFGGKARSPRPSSSACSAPSAGGSCSTRQTTAGAPPSATAARNRGSSVLRSVTAISSGPSQPSVSSSTDRPFTGRPGSPGARRRAPSSLIRMLNSSLRVIRLQTRPAGGYRPICTLIYMTGGRVMSPRRSYPVPQTPECAALPCRGTILVCEPKPCGLSARCITQLSLRGPRAGCTAAVLEKFPSRPTAIRSFLAGLRPPPVPGCSARPLRTPPCAVPCRAVRTSTRSYRGPSRRKRCCDR